MLAEYVSGTEVHEVCAMLGGQARLYVSRGPAEVRVTPCLFTKLPFRAVHMISVPTCGILETSERLKRNTVSLASTVGSQGDSTTDRSSQFERSETLRSPGAVQQTFDTEWRSCPRVELGGSAAWVPYSTV